MGSDDGFSDSSASDHSDDELSADEEDLAQSASESDSQTDRNSESVSSGASDEGDNKNLGHTHLKGRNTFAHSGEEDLAKHRSNSASEVDDNESLSSHASDDSYIRDTDQVDFDSRKRFASPAEEAAFIDDVILEVSQAVPEICTTDFSCGFCPRDIVISPIIFESDPDQDSGCTHTVSVCYACALTLIDNAIDASLSATESFSGQTLNFTIQDLSFTYQCSDGKSLESIVRSSLKSDDDLKQRMRTALNSLESAASLKLESRLLHLTVYQLTTNQKDTITTLLNKLDSLATFKKALHFEYMTFGSNLSVGEQLMAYIREKRFSEALQFIRNIRNRNQIRPVYNEINAKLFETRRFELRQQCNKMVELRQNLMVSPERGQQNRQRIDWLNRSIAENQKTFRQTFKEFHDYCKVLGQFDPVYYLFPNQVSILYYLLAWISKEPMLLQDSSLGALLRILQPMQHIKLCRAFTTFSHFLLNPRSFINLFFHENSIDILLQLQEWGYWLPVFIGEIAYYLFSLAIRHPSDPKKAIGNLNTLFSKVLDAPGMEKMDFYFLFDNHPIFYGLMILNYDFALNMLRIFHSKNILQGHPALHKEFYIRVLRLMLSNISKQSKEMHAAQRRGHQIRGYTNPQLCSQIISLCKPYLNEPLNQYGDTFGIFLMSDFRSASLMSVLKNDVYAAFNFTMKNRLGQSMMTYFHRLRMNSPVRMFLAPIFGRYATAGQNPRFQVHVQTARMPVPRGPHVPSIRLNYKVPSEFIYRLEKKSQTYTIKQTPFSFSKYNKNQLLGCFSQIKKINEQLRKILSQYAIRVESSLFVEPPHSYIKRALQNSILGSLHRENLRLVSRLNQYLISPDVRRYPKQMHQPPAQHAMISSTTPQNPQLIPASQVRTHYSPASSVIPTGRRPIHRGRSSGLRKRVRPRGQGEDFIKEELGVPNTLPNLSIFKRPASGGAPVLPGHLFRAQIFRAWRDQEVSTLTPKSVSVPEENRSSVIDPGGFSGEDDSDSDDEGRPQHAEDGVVKRQFDQSTSESSIHGSQPKRPRYPGR